MMTLVRNRYPAFIAAAFVAMSTIVTQPCGAQYNHWVPDHDGWQNMRRITPRGYVCHRVNTPVVIDGKLDDEAWVYIPWTEYFADIEGDVKTAPRLRTQAKMAWDDDYFYVAADMEERHVWATLTEHDSEIYHDNDFEIFIDPDNDNHDYYEIEINALNTEWDLFFTLPYRDGGERHNEWEIPGLKHAVHIYGTLNDPSDNDRSWSVEFAIPWEVLGEHAHKPVPPVEGDYWRVDFSRVQYRTEMIVTDGARRDGVLRADKRPGDKGENWIWSPPGVISMHCPDMWGYVQFTSKEPGTVEFTPDPLWPARIILHGVYYSQVGYKRRNGRWAVSMDELGVHFGDEPILDGPPVITPTADGYIATVRAVLPDGIRHTLTIDQVSHVTVE